MVRRDVPARRPRRPRGSPGRRPAGPVRWAAGVLRCRARRHHRGDRRPWQPHLRRVRRPHPPPGRRPALRVPRSRPATEHRDHVSQSRRCAGHAVRGGRRGRPGGAARRRFRPTAGGGRSRTRTPRCARPRRGVPFRRNSIRRPKLVRSIRRRSARRRARPSRRPRRRLPPAPSGTSRVAGHPHERHQRRPEGSSARRAPDVAADRGPARTHPAPRRNAGAVVGARLPRLGAAGGGTHPDAGRDTGVAPAVRSGDRPGRPRTLPLRRLRCGAHDAPPDRRPRRPGPERRSRCTTHRRQRRRSAGTRARAGGLGFLRPGTAQPVRLHRGRVRQYRDAVRSRGGPELRRAPHTRHRAPDRRRHGRCPARRRGGPDPGAHARPDRRLHRRHPTLRRRRLPRHRRPWASRRTRPAARLRPVRFDDRLRRRERLPRGGRARTSRPSGDRGRGRHPGRRRRVRTAPARIRRRGRRRSRRRGGDSRPRGRPAAAVPDAPRRRLRRHPPPGIVREGPARHAR